MNAHSLWMTADGPQQAMIEAELNPRYMSIGKSTMGIVFLSTPHQGSGDANFGNIIANVASAVTPGLNFFNRGDIIRDLKNGSPALFEVSSQFSNICTGITIHTFYETGGVRLVRIPSAARPLHDDLQLTTSPGF